MGEVFVIVLHVVAFLAGAALFAATVHAILASMLVPRPTTAVMARVATAPSAKVFRWLAVHRRDYEGRDAILAASGPVSVMVQLVVFILCFLLAGGLMVFGLGGQGWWESLYQSGSSLFTLGVVAPPGIGVVMLSLVSAFVGLVVVAILVGYLLQLYTAYTARESATATLALLAGEPAWGPEWLCRGAMLGEDAHDADFERWIDWISDVRLNHTVNPILNQFRSGQPRRHWLVSMVAVLDAATLQLTTLADSPSRASLVRLIAQGTETCATLRANLEFRPVAKSAVGAVKRDRTRTGSHRSQAGPEDAVLSAMAKDARSSLVGPRKSAAQAWSADADPGITREEWDFACQLMSAAGLTVRRDSDAAWSEFSFVRSTYAHNAYALAELVYATPAPWTGGRTPAVEVVWPALAVQQLKSEPGEG